MRPAHTARLESRSGVVAHTPLPAVVRQTGEYTIASGSPPLRLHASAKHPLRASTVVPELQLHPELFAAQELDHRLERIPGRARDTELITLDGDLDILHLAVLDRLGDLLRRIRRDPLLQLDLLAHPAERGRVDLARL